MAGFRLAAGPLAAAVERRLSAWAGEHAAARLWRRDHTLWFPEDRPELTDRLGWLDLPGAMGARLGELDALARSVREDGIERVALLGMGGSSLAPEVFQKVLGNAPGHPALTVLDSTHPAAVARLTNAIDPDRTLFVVASKSGGTVETLSFFRHFWKLLVDLPDRGRRFVAITDPGSGLEQLARERGFRAVILAPPDVGGRFSALCPFGLAPAALIGVPLARFLDHAGAAAQAHGDSRAPGFVLGALLGEAAKAGRDKLTLITSPGLEAFPAWLEQLIAESLGKEGRGVVPVAGELTSDPAFSGEDRVFVRLQLAAEEDGNVERLLGELEQAGHPVVRIELGSPLELGAEMLRWEVATAMAGSILGVNPFDQPDVQLAKEMAKRAMAGETGGGAPATVPAAEAAAGPLDRWLGTVAPGCYVAVQAFLAPSEANAAALAALRSALADRLRVPVTTGWGPRYLHSTGQLHKGGPASGRFLQLIDRPEVDLPIPETGPTFGRLIAAQAAGDAAALAARGRAPLRLDLGAAPAEALAALARRVASPG